MNPNDYQQPDNNKEPVPTWFQDSIPAPAAEKPTAKKLRPIVFVVIGIILLTSVGAIVLTLLMATQNNQQDVTNTDTNPTCLTETEYNRLTETLAISYTSSPYNEVKANTSFNSYPVYFDSETDNYNEYDKADIEQFVTTVSNLFKDSAYSKTLVITLSADYISGQSADVATKRLEKVYNALVSMGVPSSAIKQVPPTARAAEDELDSADVPLYLDTATLGVC
jgi:hypothetical protein